MSNPFRSLKYLPWTTLLLSAGSTVLIATILDIMALYAIIVTPQMIELLEAVPLLQLLLFWSALYGVGALAVFMTARFFKKVFLRANSLWALVGCVLLLLLVKSWSPGIPSLFLGSFDMLSIVFVTVGAFTSGRRYWR